MGRTTKVVLWSLGIVAAVGLVLVVGLVAFVAVGVANHDHDRAGPGTTPPVGSSRVAPAAMGTPASPGGGWTITVDAVELDADATVAAADPRYGPEPGRRFVIVDLTVTNTDAEPRAVDDDLDVLLGYETGDPEVPCEVDIADRFDPTAAVPPGASVSGRVCYSARIERLPGAYLEVRSVGRDRQLLDERYLAVR